jgi:hypothetical protein
MGRRIANGEKDREWGEGSRMGRRIANGEKDREWGEGRENLHLFIEHLFIERDLLRVVELFRSTFALARNIRVGR